jgi:hypothetical protein
LKQLDWKDWNESKSGTTAGFHVRSHCGRFVVKLTGIDSE